MLPIVTTETKTCKNCKLVLPVDNFYKSGEYLFAECKKCCSDRNRSNYATNRSARLAAGKRYREINETQIKIRQKHHSRKYMYGVDEVRFNSMLEDQNYLCPGCDKDLRNAKIDVDHDHACCPGPRSCGVCVRGLLCHQCNVALGQVNDSPISLRRLADYLDNRRFQL